jgi:hypothetical protein
MVMLEEDIDANCKCGANGGIHLYHFLPIFFVLIMIGILGSLMDVQPKLLYNGVAMGAMICWGSILIYMWFDNRGT